MAFTTSEILEHIAEETSPSFIGSKPTYNGDHKDLIDELGASISSVFNNDNTGE